MNQSNHSNNVHKESDDYQLKRARRKTIAICAAALIAISLCATGAWAVTTHSSEAKAQARASALASEKSRKTAQNKEKAKISASATASTNQKDVTESEGSSQAPSTTGSPSPTGAQSSVPGSPQVQPNPSEPQPDPAGLCAAYQGTYRNSSQETATLTSNCSVSTEEFGSRIHNVSFGADGANGWVEGAMELTMEPRYNNLVIYALFPKGVAVGYPGEDVSHNRLVGHSGGPINAIGYKDYLKYVFVMP